MSKRTLTYKIKTTKSFDKRLLGLPANLQKRIINKIRQIAENPYATNNNVKKLQGRDGYRLRVGDWRIIYELHDDILIMIILEMDSRGGIYQ
ncbi:MAG: type II toxin-antitoxin system RelE/ParE family toxin [Rickettsiales bacterium]